MKTSPKPLLALTIALLLGAISGPSTVHAAAKPKVKSPETAAQPTAKDDADAKSKLQDAYNTLNSSGQSFDGHRTAALSAIASAGGLLGDFATGGAAAHEDLSDLQLRSVQMKLVHAGRAVPAGENKTKIVGFINSAVDELNGALGTDVGAKGKTARAVDAVGDNSVEAASLERIHAILAVAKHDYQGHRQKAMDDINKASLALGGVASGSQSAGESQATSDAQLRQAQDLLVQVRDSYTAADPKKVLTDLNNAVNQLSLALAVK